jgi:hypothetical protein
MDSAIKSLLLVLLLLLMSLVPKVYKVSQTVHQVRTLVIHFTDKLSKNNSSRLLEVR